MPKNVQKRLNFGQKWAKIVGNRQSQFCFWKTDKVNAFVSPKIEKNFNKYAFSSLKHHWVKLSRVWCYYVDSLSRWVYCTQSKYRS